MCVLVLIAECFALDFDKKIRCDKRVKLMQVSHLFYQGDANNP